MRTVGLLYTGTLMAVLTVGIICVLTMKSSYAETIRDSLDDSIVTSVKLLQVDKKLVEYEDSSGNALSIPKQDIDWSMFNGESLPEGTEFIEGTASDELIFRADFIRYLTANLDSRISEIEVNIYGVDTEVGALSVGVVAKFQYPSGQTDTVESYKTVILNKYLK